MVYSNLHYSKLLIRPTHQTRCKPLSDDYLESNPLCINQYLLQMTSKAQEEESDLNRHLQVQIH